MNKETNLTLDIEALQKIAGYGHWIPALKGFQRSYLATNYPGWDWNQIIPQLIREKIVHVNSLSASHQRLANGLYISIEIESITMMISEYGIKATVRKTHSKARR
jgi:hypothetical protein